MHFKQIFVALALSSLAIAGHDGGQEHKKGGKNSTESACAEMSRLTKLTDLANNATKLSELETKHHLNSTQIDDIKAKAAKATTRLQTLQANATLTSECAVVDASKKLKAQCKEMKRLTKMADLATNTTAQNELQTKHNLTAAEMDKIKEKAANATTKLNKLKSNATLVASCQNMKSTKDGEIGAKGATSSASSYRTLGNGLFAVVMGGIAVLLMA